jgi:hypothetical protein
VSSRLGTPSGSTVDRCQLALATRSQGKGAAERARGRVSEWRRFGTTAAAREEKINRTRAAGGVSQGLACRPAGGIGRCTVDGALQ